MDAEKTRIACFICNWALPEEKPDATRTRKRSFSMSFVRLPCLGRLDPSAILEVFEKGADGVLLIGCAPSDCHFVNGNFFAELTVKVLKKLLSLAKLEPNRLSISLVSPAQDTSFAEIMRNFARKLGRLGPSPLTPEKCDLKISENISAAKNAVSDFHLSALIAKERELTSKANAYNETMTPEEYDDFLNSVIEAEFVRHKILLATRNKASSVKELSDEVGLKPSVVFRHVLNLRRKGMIVLDHIEGNSPLYKALEAR